MYFFNMIILFKIIWYFTFERRGIVENKLNEPTEEGRNYLGFV